MGAFIADAANDRLGLFFTTKDNIRNYSDSLMGFARGVPQPPVSA